MDIEIEIEHIMSKCKFHKYYLKNFIMKKIRELIYDGIKMGRMGIVGVGKHTTHFVSDFKEQLPRECIFIDQKWKELSKMECYQSMALSSYDKINELDVVIVSSYEYRKEMTKKVKTIKSDIKIIDIYEIFENLGVYMVAEYYNTWYHPYISNYLYLILLQQQIKNEMFERKWILQDIIFQFIQMRDLYHAKEYIKFYLGQDYDDDMEFKVLFSEIEELEKKIQDGIKKRNKKDIIWLWQDGLGYEISLEMPYLNKCRSRGMDFKNAYSISRNTRNVYAGIFERKSEYEIYTQPKGKNEVAQLLKKEGYAAYRIWEKDDKIPLEKFIYRKEDGKPEVTNHVPASLIYWEMLKLLLENETPVFALAHFLLETHEPFCAPILKEYDVDYIVFPNRIKERKREFQKIWLNSALYLDILHEYYAQFLPEDCIKIYMSDHGWFMNEYSKTFKEEVVHIPLVITGGKIKCKECESLFSINKFYELLEYVLMENEEKFEDLFCEYLDINGIDMYAKRYIDIMLMTGFGEMHLAYCGVRTLEDVYILEATGDEYYGNPKKIEKMQFISESNALRVDELRKICKKSFIDITRDEKFKETYRVYQAIGKERKF